MRICAHVIALGFLLVAAPASGAELAESLRRALWEALEVHAPIPDSGPKLLEPAVPARSKPVRETPRPSDPDPALAVAEEGRRAALELATDAAAAMTDERQGEVTSRNVSASANDAKASELDGESAVGLMRYAEERGSTPPTQGTPRTPPLQLETASVGQGGP